MVESRQEGEVSYARVLILHAPPWNSQSLVEFVEDCIRDAVFLICVIGYDCQRVEDVIDELVVGDGSDASRFIVTTSHPDETLDKVVAFAEDWRLLDGIEDPVQEVWLAKG